MLSSIVSFLAGSAFRFLIGRLTEWLEKKQEHLQELERIREQEKIDQAKHGRQKELIELQHQLGITEIQIAGDVEVKKLEASAFAEAMKVANTPTGVKWIDGWNGSIRPAAATISLALWLLAVIRTWFEITDWDKNLIASVLGYYFADRHLGKK